MSLDLLRTELAEHLTTRPTPPLPFLANSPEAVAYRQAMVDFTDRRNRIEHEVWKLGYPQMPKLDRQPKVVLGPGSGTVQRARRRR